MVLSCHVYVITGFTERFHSQSSLPFAQNLHIIIPAVSGFYPPNLESKSGATFSLVLGSGAPISDSSFPVYFGLVPPIGRKFC